MKKKRKGLLYLIISFVLVFALTIGFFTYVIVKNNSKKSYNGIVDKDYDKFSLKLDISKTWVNDENLDTQSFGQQFDFAISDETKYNLNDWTLTINFDGDKFELIKIDSCWNIEPTVDGNKVIITPNQDITLKSVKPDETNAFGFIFIVKNKIVEDDFYDFTFTISGTPHRIVTTYAMFWIDLFFIFAFIAFLTTYIALRIKERHFEKSMEQTYSIISQSMNTFGSLIDVKDPYTKDHSARVSYYSTKIARKLGLDDEFVKNIAYIALMHDCGKLLIDDDILTKPAKLTKEEFEIMKTHTTNGGRALKNFTSIKEIKDGAMYHHERFDGSGYPEGLKGENIPLCARIIGVADALDAMSSDRCYRKRLSVDAIIKELNDCSGSQFDPKIAKVTVEMIENGEIDIHEN